MSHEQADTRVTAYVFGELSPEETVALERELAQSSELRDEVAAVRETIGALKGEFESRATTVGDSQRQVIEHAIEQRSADGIVLRNDRARATSKRRLAIVVVLAASVLIVCSLTYPYVADRTVAPISMRDQSRPPSIVSDNIAATTMEQEEEEEVLDVLSYGFGDQAKDLPFEAATESAEKQISRKKSEGPSATTSNVRQLGQRLTENHFTPRDEQAAAPTRELMLQQLELPRETPAAAPKSMLRRQGIVIGEDKSFDLVDDLTEANDGIANRSSVELQKRDSSSNNPAARLPESRRQFNDNFDFGMRPVETDSIAAESEGKESLPAGVATGGASYGKGLENKEKIAGRGIQVDNGSTLSKGKLQGGYGLPKDTTDIRVEETQIKGRPTAAQVTDMLDVLEKDGAGQVDASGKGATSAPTRRSRRRRGGMEMEMMGDMEEMSDMDMEAGHMMLEGDDVAHLRSGERAAPGLGMGMGMEFKELGEAIIASPQGDRFDPIEDNPFVAVAASPLSTFSIDVDTASYSKVRALLKQNALPRPDAVRIEEMLNYFNYDYAPPEDEHPFAASMDIAACPWNPKHRLARIGIKGKVIEETRPRSNLVFLLDVSGSMDDPKKLPLVITGMKMLVNQLTENDKVGIVVYAGAAGLILDSTHGDQKQQIVDALDQLSAGGSTNGGQGIMLAYQLARDNFIPGGINRVILCTDGDFNVGVTGDDQLVKIVQENAKSNIFLSVLGFGTGNLNDAMIEKITNKGNGNYAFVDSKSEAKKVLVEELGGTLVTIAKDVKIQVEFNPKQVASYRLIGYGNRILKDEDFENDKIDAGEIGAGHTVTALYEIVPGTVDDANVPPEDELRYQKRARLSKAADSGETLVLKLRYKQPEGDTSTPIEFPFTDSGKGFTKADRDFQFAASVAAFGMLLRNSPHKGDATFAAVAEIASAAAEDDKGGHRQEFLKLVAKAKQLRGE